LVRSEGIAEPEDHMAFLCETMAGLIRAGEGAFALDEEKFFARHLQPWARGFFKDLERVADAPLYAALGQMGRVVIEIEQAAFALPA
jgi:TorA maturation chaperone TorD